MYRNMLIGCVLKDSPDTITMPRESFHLSSLTVPWPQQGQLCTSHTSTSRLLLNALPLATSRKLFLKTQYCHPCVDPGIASALVNLLCWAGTTFRPQMFSSQKKPQTNKWKNSYCFLPWIGNIVSKWCTIKTGKQTYFRIPKC